MTIYILMFIISSICSLLSYKCSKNKILKLIFMIIAILLPSIIAGNRSLSIGTDISVYGNYMHYVASNLSVGDFFQIFGYSDIFFSIFTIFIGIIFKNVHIYLFAIQLLNCIVIYKACDNYNEKIPVWLSYLLFLLILYFRQLNLLRQGIALSFSILAISYLIKNNNKKFLIFTIVASLFHISAIITILIKGLKLISDNKEKQKISIVNIYCFLLVLVVFFMPILNFITSSGILPSKYTYSYFMNYLNINNEFDNLGTFFKLFWCVVTLIIASTKQLKYKINNFNFFFHLVFIDFILWLLNIHIFYADRLSFYFGFAYVIFYIPQIIKLFKNDKVNKPFSYIIIIILFLFYWFVRFIVQNAGAVYPYVHY